MTAPVKGFIRECLSAEDKIIIGERDRASQVNTEAAISIINNSMAIHHAIAKHRAGTSTCLNTSKAKSYQIETIREMGKVSNHITG